MLNEQQLTQAWIDFVQIRGKYTASDKVYIDARNKLVAHYYPIVFKVAERMHQKIKEVDIDDLVAWGTDGLFHAVNRFDPDLKNKFETFAIHRIRGSILDNIRQVDWVPRLVRQRNSQLQKMQHQLECKLNREPTIEELAQAMNLSVEEFVEFRGKASPVGCVSMHAASATVNGDGEGLQIEDIKKTEVSPNEILLRQEMFRKLLGRNFIPLERKIVHLHYYENMTMREIADKLGFSESRISQMHAKIIERLQKKVELNPEYMSGLKSMLQV